MSARRTSRGKGAAAIEMAFILLYCFTLLPIALYFARYTLHAGVMQQAMQGAARFISDLPPEDLVDTDRRTVALAVARAMVDDTVASARLDSPPDGVTMLCDTLDCASFGSALPPANIFVSVHADLGHPIFMGDLDAALPASSQIHQTRLRYGY